MSLAGILTNIATQLINQFGEAVTFNREIQGGLDPTTGETQAGTILTFTAFGVPENYTSKEINNVTILQGDRKVTVYKTTEIPQINDSLTLNGADYRVINVEQIRTQGQDIIYQMQVRV